MRRTLILIGAVIIAVGVFWPWLKRLPLGRLPGDIYVERPDFKLVIPITTMLILSGLLSLVLWLFRK